ncbi:MAG: HAD family hydrolase [Bacteroidales bacterium]|nr:HAD family hydrolase [Bacteroidales bacterium]
MQTLDRLNNVQLGIISNCSVFDSFSISNFEISNRFDVIINSYEVGFTKSSIEIFQIAENLSNIRAENLVYVGDSVISDILGSYNSGWNSVFLNRKNILLPTTISSKIIEINSLLELPSILLEMNN